MCELRTIASNKNRVRCVAGGLCLSLLFAVAVSPPVHGQLASEQKEADEADLSALLRESIHRSNQNWEKMSRHYYNYTFKWRRVQRKRVSEGTFQEESELYEVFIPKAECWTKNCRRAVVLLEENGKPRPLERIEKERLQAGRKIEEAEREESKRKGAAATLPVSQNWMRFNVQSREVFGKGTTVVLDGQEILKTCLLSHPRRERLAGREMIALDFHPRPQATFEEKSAYLPRIEGRIWIDAEDKVFVRLIAWPLGTKFDEAVSSEELLTHAALAYGLVRTKEGIWFFNFGRINGARFPDLFSGLKTDFSIEQFDYVNFKVEVEDSKILAPVN